MTKNPKVSIIVPIYNTEKYLDKCLDSIVNQTYTNLEIILVDDGSTDNSGKIADKYAKSDKRIKIIHQKNAGQSNARNTGLKKSTGTYFCFVDSDDYIKNNFVEKLLEPYLNNSGASLTVSGIRFNWLKTHTFKDAYLNPLRPKKQSESKKAYILYILAIDGRLYSSVNKLFKKEYLKETRFDETINFAEDTKFVLDYLNNIPVNSKISFVLEPLYYYNYGTEDSTMRKTSSDWGNWRTSYDILKKWLGKNPTSREKFWLHLVYLRWHVSHFRSKHRLKTR